MMEKIVSQLLAIDEKEAPFELLGFEVGKKEPLEATLSLDDGRKVALQGTAGRIDLYQDKLRVFDYKTGHQENRAASISLMLSSPATKANRGMVQLLLYAWLIKQEATYASYPVVPHLIRTLSIFDPTMETRLLLRTLPQQAHVPLEDITPYLPELEEGLKRLITNILDPALPFVQTDNHQACKHCPYQRICERY
jgi:hypothetical protein